MARIFSAHCLLLFFTFVVIFALFINSPHTKNYFKRNDTEIVSTDKVKSSIIPLKVKTFVDGCEVEEGDFNERIPFENLHEYWISKNVSRENTYHKQIRLLAAYRFENHTSIEISSLHLFGHFVWCRYFDCNQKEIGEPYPTKIFPESTAYCPRRRNAKFMTLTKTKGEKARYPLPLIDRTMKEPEHFFSVCMAPIYGDEPKWLQLIEFIEHYKLQGATWFYIYVIDIDQYSRFVLEDYVRRGEIEVINLYDGYQKRTNRYWHMVQINDCLQRSRIHSKWTALVDIDERLVRTDNTKTIYEHLSSIKNESIASISFRQRWILKTEELPPKFESERQVLQWMPTMRNTNTSALGPRGHTAKCIIRSEMVASMFIHYPYALYPGAAKVYVDPEIGYCRHYRDVRLGDWGRKWLKPIEKFGNFTPTALEATYSLRLQRAVVNRAKYVYEPYDE